MSLAREVPIRRRGDGVGATVKWVSVLGAVGFVVVGAVSGMTMCRHHHRMPEPNLELLEIARAAKRHFLATGAFPEGRSQLVPPWSCCPRACAVPARAWADDAVWAALDFKIEQPFRFQYRYESRDGTSFHAVAIGDRDCDGITIRYELDGTSDDGGPHITMAEPEPNTD